MAVPNKQKGRNPKVCRKADLFELRMHLPIQIMLYTMVHFSGQPTKASLTAEFQQTNHCAETAPWTMHLAPRHGIHLFAAAGRQAPSRLETGGEGVEEEIRPG